MFGTKKSVIAILFVAFFSTALAASAAGADAPGVIMKKGRVVKRLIKHSIVPYRPVLGMTKTGQKTSYAPGDDGDLQRGSPWPEPRFVDHGDGTVTDRVTGLVWTKDARQIDVKLNWYDALGTCNALIFAGHHDWRMPNIKEMLSLIDYGAHGPALPEDHPFVNLDAGDSYWTSTTSSAHVSQAWRVTLKDGGSHRTSKANGTHYVWPVRRGRQHIW